MDTITFSGHHAHCGRAANDDIAVSGSITMGSLDPDNLPRFDPAVLVGTSVMFFTVINLGKLVPYAALGLLTVHNLSTSLLLAPLGALGIVLGIWLRTRISTQLFYRLSYGLLLLTGSKLIHDGVGNLL